MSVGSRTIGSSGALEWQGVHDDANRALQVNEDWGYCIREQEYSTGLAWHAAS